MSETNANCPPFAEKLPASGGRSAPPCSPEQVIKALQNQIQHDIQMCAETITELERKLADSVETARDMKNRVVAVLERLQESRTSHQKYAGLAQGDVARMCHAGAADAYCDAARLLSEAIWHEAAF